MAFCSTPMFPRKNLLGKGQGLSGNFAIGSKRQDYILSLNDPYFNDSKMQRGLDAVQYQA
jgi:outer membrane protein assembly factor BamA